jgi:hypothetical protein
MKKMKLNILLYAYMLNTVAFILHEMDAVFWKEWELFGIRSEYAGLVVFILAHIVLYLTVLHGMLNLGNKTGLGISLVMGLFGMAHFILHSAIGENYFVTNFSSGIINVIFVLSSVQFYFTVRRLKDMKNDDPAACRIGAGE